MQAANALANLLHSPIDKTVGKWYATEVHALQLILDALGVAAPNVQSELARVLWNCVYG